MRKRVLLFLVIGLLAVAAFVVSRSSDGYNKNSIDQVQSTEVPNSGSTVTESIDSANEAGLYVEYSESKLAAADGTRVLFFHASWCPQCRALEADIEKQGVPEGTTIFKVDYDNAQDLRKKYGVTLQTTVVKVDEKGNLISKFTPYQKPTLQNALDNL